MFLRSFLAWFSWAAFAIAISGAAIAQDSATPAAQPAGVIKVARIAGEVYAVDHATGLKTRLSLSSLVTQGQAVQTGPNASVVLAFSNGAIVNVKANTVLEIDEFSQNPFADDFRVRDAMHEPSISTTHLELRQGEIISQVKKLNRDAGSSFTVDTPTGAAGIRGTAFRISYTFQDNTAHFVLSMAEGLIRFIPVQGHAVEVPAGKELAFGADLDPKTHAVTSVGEIGAPTDLSPGDAAALQQEVTDSIGSALNVDFAPANPTSGSPNGTNRVNTANPSNNSTPTTDALAAPPPVPPAPTTSPGDGTPRS